MGNSSGVSDIYIIVGLSALLVSTSRAIPGPLEREASDRDWLHVFFYYRADKGVYQRKKTPAYEKIHCSRSRCNRNNGRVWFYTIRTCKCTSIYKRGMVKQESIT